MRTCSLVLLAVLAGCDAEHETLPPATPYEIWVPCRGHVIDGRFTQQPSNPKCIEWLNEPIEGIYGDLYVQYDRKSLFVLNDWHLKTDEPARPDEYNQFLLSLAGGMFLVEVRVFGDQRIEVYRNGELVKDGGPIAAIGASSFEGSPRHPTPHTIFEFAIDAPAGPITIKEKDPGMGSSSLPPEQGLVDEPTVTVGSLSSEGGGTLAAATGPTLVWITPLAGAPGDTVTLTGVLLGTSMGKVSFGSVDGDVLSWSPTQIVVKVPAITDDVGVRVVLATKVTNALPFALICSASCNLGKCGDPGCVGACGRCPTGTACDLAGACACVPQCQGKNCGDDGCGGDCGTCKGGVECLGGTCCVPKCSGKECGDNGCGGSCGTCPPGMPCAGGKCSCTPSCEEKQCGYDGCGGSCGSCPAGKSCGTLGTCECKPSCTGKQCGNDGCGGLCGSCAAGEMCSGGTCVCAPDCIPKSKDCGNDGCGGSCGACDANQTCSKIGVCVAK